MNALIRKSDVIDVLKETGIIQDNDLIVVSALPSLYPLQPFEEEAIRRVVASAKGDAWIPVSERMPTEEELKADRNKVFVQNKYGDRFIAVYCYNTAHTKMDFYRNHCVVPDVIAWRRLPLKYELKGAAHE